MSYLSTTENVGGIPQNISEASCATQYKMAVESVPAGCASEVNMFINDNSGDEQTYISHLNDNFFHTKFKIDPNELYTFHDTDVIAGEITVSHTEESFVFPDTVNEKNKLNFFDSPSKELDLIDAFTNGDIKEEYREEVVSNGHYQSFEKLSIENHEETKTTHTKVHKVKSQSHAKEMNRINSAGEIRGLSVQSPKSHSSAPTPCNKVSINSVNTNHIMPMMAPKSGLETFLDVFKREQGLVEGAPTVVKTEPAPPPPKLPPHKKTPSVKPSSQSKARRGRGPTVHEALQRIPTSKRAIPLPNRAWHAPNEQLFDCGPLDDRRPNPFKPVESSSSDDENMPHFEIRVGPMCVEEIASESRLARLALRRAALRRHVARAYVALRLASDFKESRSLVAHIKKQHSGQKSSCRVQTQTINQMLALRGMPAVFTSQEKRKLRESGWSGGENSIHEPTSSTCAEDGCYQTPLPCARYCLDHVTLAPEQRLYASCAAVFAGGTRCKQPLLPLQDQTPLCAEHAWKRDNYDKINRDCKPKKIPRVRTLSTASVKRTRRRRRPARPSRHQQPPPLPPSASHSLSEINVCSNSSTYDSSEDTAIGGLSENEFIASSNAHELEVGEVGHVPPDDILDPAVLSQIPDEEFTEFFNEADDGSSFAEGSELAAALEAVLDERALDTISDCVFPTTTHSIHTNTQATSSHATGPHTTGSHSSNMSSPHSISLVSNSDAISLISSSHAISLVSSTRAMDSQATIVEDISQGPGEDTSQTQFVKGQVPSPATVDMSSSTPS